MAERLDIIVTERGSRVVKRRIDDIGGSARRSGDAVALLRRGLGLLGAGFAVREIIRTADAFTSIQNTLRVAGVETDNMASATQRLFDISNKTRTSIEANVSLFQRLSFAADELGASQEQLFTFTETVGKAIAIQGGAASTASGALLQLSQAMGAGIVRAEEFNSILEGAFPIALAAAKGLDAAGGSVAKLRSLIISGQVTSKEFFDALLSQADELEEAFARTTPTVGQAFTVMRNQFTLFVGRLNEATGSTAALSRVILILANNLDTVALALLPVLAGLTAMGGRAIIAGIKRTTLAARGLVAALGPIGLAAAAIVAVAVAVDRLTGGLFEAEGVTVRLGDVITATFTVTGRALRQVGDALVNVLGPAFRGAGVEVNTFRDLLAASVNGAAFMVDAIIGLIVGLGQAIPEVIKTIPSAFKATFVLAGNLAVRAITDQLNKIIDIANRFGADFERIEFQPFGREVAEEAIVNINAVTEAFNSGFELRPAQRFIGAIRDEAIAVAQLRIETEAQQSALETLNEETDTNVTLTKAQASAFKSLRDQLDPVGAAVRELAEGTALINAAYATGNIAIEERDFLLRRLAQSLEDQLDPLGAVNEQLDEQMDLLRMSSEAAKVESQVLQTIQSLQESGIELTATEISQLRTKFQLIEELNDARTREESLLKSIVGAQEDFNKNQSALNNLLATGRINAEQFRIAQRDLNIELLSTKTDVLSGFKLGFLEAQKGMEDFASTSKELITDAFSDAKEAVADFFKTGTFSANKFFNNLADNLIDLGTQIAFSGIANIGQNLFSQGSSFLGGLFGGGGSSIPGFANGGGGILGGRAGIDQNTLSLNGRPIAQVSKGEQLSVSPAGRGGSMVLSPTFNFNGNMDENAARRTTNQAMRQLKTMLEEAERDS
jgi:tape measure domain-containing protein